MFRSIRARIAVFFILFYVATMAGLGSYLSYQVRQNKLQDLEQQLQTSARMLAHTLASLPLDPQNSPALEAFAREWADVVAARITLIAPDGQVLGDSEVGRAQMDNQSPRDEVQSALQNGAGRNVRLSSTTGALTLYVAVPVVQQGQVVGIVRLARPLTGVDETITSLEQNVLVFALGATFLAILLALTLAERTARPLRELTEAARRIARGEANVPLIPRTSDEVGELTRAVKLMSQKLQDQIKDIETERGKLGAILRQMTSAVVMVNPSGEIRLMNAVAEAMFGIEETAATGQSLVEVLRHHQFVELWQACARSGESQTLTLDLPTKRLSIQAIATPLGDLLAGHVLLVFQDMTRIRQLETVRQDFISNISHELRTPLASLKALTETLLDGGLEDLPAARRFLTRIETEVDSLTQIVQELLELSRIESGRVPIRLQQCDPKEIVQKAYERLRLQAERAGLAVSIEYGAGLPHVMADPPRMEQVLINLIHNAIKFTPSGGKIILRAYRQPNARTGNQEVIFEVRDTGVGIPADDLPRIFERFYKADRSRSGGGTGLGLAIARHLVEAHKGRIWAESVERKGSTFYFSLIAAEN